MRLFVAIELPDPLRDSLARLIERLSKDIPSNIVRWVRPEGIHLTLKFLGEVEAGRTETMQRVVSESGSRHSSFTFSVDGLGCFPNLSRPRVIWVGIREASGELSALHAELEQAFAEHGFEKENRRFHPHLTLGRVRRDVRRADLGLVSEVIGSAGPIALGEFDAQHVCLFRSVLKPTGAVYTRLLAAPLKDGE